MTSHDPDREFCEAMLPRVSRTFALSIAALPDTLREPVRVSYLLCRIADTIEDDHRGGIGAREALFDTFDRLLDDDAADPRALDDAADAIELGAGTDDRALSAEASRVFRCFRALPEAQRVAIRPHVAEMSRGMREIARRADAQGALRLRDFDDLERYCYFVAGTVGNLLTDLFEQEVPELDDAARSALRARAVSFGIGLQLVNIVKDVAEDFERGDSFLPEALAAEHGLALDAILDPESRPAALRVVGALTARAREHLGRAVEYTLLWPAASGRAVRTFCAVPLALAFLTLDEVERGHDTLIRGRSPKVSRDSVVAIFSEAERAAGDDDTLRAMLAAPARAVRQLGVATPQ